MVLFYQPSRQNQSLTVKTFIFDDIFYYDCDKSHFYVAAFFYFCYFTFKRYKFC